MEAVRQGAPSEPEAEPTASPQDRAAGDVGGGPRRPRRQARREAEGAMNEGECRFGNLAGPGTYGPAASVASRRRSSLTPTSSWVAQRDVGKVMPGTDGD